MQIEFRCNKSIAYDSPDHIFPCGTLNDNSRNSKFNKKLYHLYRDRQLAILDLGCSGGAFIEDCVNDGHLAFGLEGSDLCKKTGRAAWSAIPKNLFTCDITEDFGFFVVHADGSSDRMLFDVITAWEVMEHIHPDKMDALIDRIVLNMAPNGLFCCSIPYGDHAADSNYVWHQSIKEKEWWEARFDGKLLYMPTLEPYFGNDRIRYEPTGVLNWNFVKPQ